ncbi:MAG: AI-2E family transporter [Haloferacaceae archaeon]
MGGESGTRERRYVLAGVFVGFLAIAAALLAGVLGTIFFALTVGYLLAPVRRYLCRRGIPPRLAAAATATLALLAAVGVLAPLVIVVLLRLETVLAALSALPETVTLTAGPFTRHLVLAEVIDLLVNWLTTIAARTAAALPALLVKAALFFFLVYSLLAHRQSVQEAVTTVVPPRYRDLVESLHERARKTLFGIYVLQALTAFGTFLIALPFFFFLGYGAPIALATAAGILQFIPVVGPSVLLVGLSGYHFLLGEASIALAVLIGGGILVAGVPDVIVRAWLSSGTAELPGSLYLIGFVGGAFSLGLVGIIAGPLVVALVVESGSQLAAAFEADGSAFEADGSAGESLPGERRQ